MNDTWNTLWKVNEMNVMKAAEQRLQAARSAPIPNLAEIRRLDLLKKEAAKQWLEALEEDWHALYFICRCGSGVVPTVVVHQNDYPLKSPPRGFCSPVKTEKTRQFEALVQRIFSGARSATTEWSGKI